MASKDGLETFIGKQDVLKATGWSNTTLWRRCRDGSFPAPLRTSKHRIAWILREVKAWQLARLQEREEPQN